MLLLKVIYIKTQTTVLHEEYGYLLQAEHVDKARTLAVIYCYQQFLFRAISLLDSYG